MDIRIDREFLLNLASALVRINTENPPGRELEAASFLAERLADLGIRSAVDRLDDVRANAICILEGSRAGPTLLLNSHLDTVPVGERDKWRVEPLGGLIRNGKLYGRGSADAKGSIAAMAASLKALLNFQEKIGGKVVLAAVADEEVGGIGTKALLSKYGRFDFAVVGEPTGLRVCTAHKGRLEVKVRVKGKPAHASMPHEGINAILAATSYCNEIERIAESLSKVKGHPLVGKPTVAVTMISGGIKSNVIPDECVLIIDRRLIPGEDPEAVKAEFEGAASKVMTERRGAEFFVSIVRYHKATEVITSERIVQAALRAVSKVLGVRSEPSGLPAYTDLGCIVAAGTPGVVLGPGELSQAHSYDESVPIEELEAAARIYCEIAMELLGRQE
ncbi:MAG: M20 family metallopeptidase [Nitrososphaerota archaeon]|nr:M20 family metallopeptidase [Aigarchaeota archaeon]MDW8076422.1 M20 family metallopeptidase [Nitrososphaerota archaeon]